ncbi:MAG: histidinol dehydrogenase [Verrucomicrobia bacterium]|nr:histidinol dehydrogenase [Verrucomicrobiota bacterium]
MKIIRFAEPEFEQLLTEQTRASSLFDPGIEAQTRAIVDDVAARGDAALLEYTRRFDGAALTAGQLAVTKAEWMQVALEADATLRSAIADAHRNIAWFSRRSLRRNWTAKNAHGAVVGEKFDPFQRVGIYIPGGAAPLVSTALMTITLARVAGCPEIVVCTPCNARGEVNAGLLFAARTAGATEVYRVGGAQAVAAMAYGTATIRGVQKVFGPGNAYVVAAKRLLFGRVAVDLLPGPSEVLVLADHTAHPPFAAADLLAQAEHGSGHERIWLVTPSARLLRAVGAEIRRQWPRLGRRALVERVLDAHACLIQVKSMDQGVEVVNRLAPEHCEIMTRQPRVLAARIRTAGAIFLGRWSPTALGDYVAGPSHTLPTGGAGAAFAGLTADQFQRRTSVVGYGRAALRKAMKPLQALAAVEGLDAHGRSASIRLNP